ncbi:amino acid ABC transporter substrate-binding protein [Dongia sp.]|uniref:amino acid ABC transporter substrate-binding protein n=1 Tax=Dongia sp. TaxID=1977262 RepID=UPI0037535F6B
MMIRISLALALVAGALGAAAASDPAAAGPVTDRIKAAGKIVIGYREGAAPFSFKNDQGQPAGYVIDVCQAVADDLKAPVEWAPLPADNPFAAVAEGKVDLLCGATETLSRRKEVSFSIPIFRSGLGVMVRSDAPVQLRQVLNGDPAGPVWRGSPARVLDQKTFAVIKGTTSEDILKGALRKLQISANVTEVDSFQAGVAAVADRSADVLLGDRSILVESAQSSPEAANLLVIDRIFTTEPVALPLDRNDEDFRLAVDQALSNLYRSDRFRDIYRKWFGEPGEAALDYFRAAALPD